jgi:hypothetical protein
MESDERLLTRREANALLILWGYTKSPSLLSRKAQQGKGPPHIFFNGRTLYYESHLLMWLDDNHLPSTEMYEYIREQRRLDKMRL